MNEDKQWYRRAHTSQHQEKIWRATSKITALSQEIRKIKNRLRGKIENDTDLKLGDKKW